MKTPLLVPSFLVCLFFLTEMPAATEVDAGWQAELAAAQQASHQDAGGRARADAILHAVLDASRHGLVAREASGRPAEPAPAGASLDAAAAQAAYSVMAVLYPGRLSALDARLAESLANLAATPSALRTGREWGQRVTAVILAEQGDAVALNFSSFALAVKAPVSVPPVPDLLAEQGALAPGRYRFTPLAGTPGAQGYWDDTGAAARFDRPAGIAVDAAGIVYVSENSAHTIRKISPDGVVTTLAGSAGQQGSQDGLGAAARFNEPSGVAVDGAGNVYVADTRNHAIRRIDPSGQVTTVAGKAGQSGTVNGTRESARFYLPAYLAVDAAGNVFVTEDKWSDRSYGSSSPIRKIARDGTVSSVKVEPVVSLFGPPSKYPYFDTAKQICVDRAGNLYVIDSNGWDYSTVAKLTPAAGGGHYEASLLVPPESPGVWATGIGIDGTGRLCIRSLETPLSVLTPDGGWETRAISGNFDDGVWGEQVAVSDGGDLYIVRQDQYSGGQFGAVVRGVFDPKATGPTILIQPAYQTPWRGESARFQVSATGTPPLSYQWCFNFTPITGATDAIFELQNAQRENLGFYSVVVTDSGGSIASRAAPLGMHGLEPLPTPESTSSPAPSSSAGPGATSSGGGSFDAGLALTVLGLLAAAARRGGRTFNIAALGTRGMKERK